VTQNLTFLILGLGNGGILAAFGLSLAVFCRSPGVVNFATAAIACTRLTRSTAWPCGSPTARPLAHGDVVLERPPAALRDDTELLKSSYLGRTA
jgi:hypothetical protein